MLDADAKALARFYDGLDELDRGFEGIRRFSECSGRDPWPSRGIYFFFEPGEKRGIATDKLRVVRVGTHGVSANSRSTLWDRLKTHKGNSGGGGNHRSSIFRQHAGFALMRSGYINVQCPTWGIGMVKPASADPCENIVEQAVSVYLGTMSILWIPVADEPGPTSDRAFLERNIIALLSRTNRRYGGATLNWLGKYSQSTDIRASSLWNVDHVKREFDDRALSIFEDYVDLAIHQKIPPARSLAPQGWARWHLGNELPLGAVATSPARPHR